MNPAHIKLAAKAVVFAMAARETYVARKQKRAAAAVVEAGVVLTQVNEILMEECTKLNNKLQTTEAREAYLIALLNEHDVPCTEFDLIVLNELTQ